MNTKLIMVEGIPGSGKSTFAQKITEYYKNKGVNVNLFNEGDAHPADLAWSACVPLNLLDTLLLKYSEIENDIRKNMSIDGDYAIISYTQVKTNNNAFYKELESYEIYDNRVAFDIFCDLIYSRWQAFGKQALKKDELNIFECAFLQNNVGELMNFQLANKNEIQKHLNKLLAYVENLSPVLVYLSQPSVKETIENVAKDRVFPDGKWIDMIVSYSENTPYGRVHNRKGVEGAIQSFEDRKHIELDIIKTLPIKTIIIRDSNNDWKEMWRQVEAFLCAL